MRLPDLMSMKMFGLKENDIGNVYGIINPCKTGITDLLSYIFIDSKLLNTI